MQKKKSQYRLTVAVSEKFSARLKTKGSSPRLPRYIAICDISRYFLYIAICDIPRHIAIQTYIGYTEIDGKVDGERRKYAKKSFSRCN